ncbi:hypothetical protein IKO50_05705 [bacterium]|nr:hypothetical protein [bacterium]
MSKKTLEEIIKESIIQSGEFVSIEELKNFCNLNVEVDADGKIKKAYFGEKKTRKPRKKKSETPVEPKTEEIEEVEAEEVKPKPKAKKK